MVKLTSKHHTEAGIVFAMLLIIAGFWTDTSMYFKLAFAALFLALAVPKIFLPFTFLWFNLSQVLGFITSRVILTVIYLAMIVPVSFFRKMAGKDTLMLRGFKKSVDSVFIHRDITFGKQHLNNTY